MVSLPNTLRDTPGIRGALSRVESEHVNVGDTERLVSAIAGGVLTVLAFRQRGVARGALAVLGGALIHRGVTGRCMMYEALGVSSAGEGGARSPVASVPRGEGRKFEHAVTVNRPAEELYRFWRNFENLPHFMSHLKSVTRVDDQRSHWVVKGPAGSTVEWDAVIHNEVPGEIIAWRTVEDADVNHAGSVHFTPAPGGLGTEVRVILNYEPPAGRLGVAIAKLLGEEPEQQVRDDLRRFKRIMEAGELPTTEGQPSGREAARA